MLVGGGLQLPGTLTAAACTRQDAQIDYSPHLTALVLSGHIVQHRCVINEGIQFPAGKEEMRSTATREMESIAVELDKDIKKEESAADEQNGDRWWTNDNECGIAAHREDLCRSISGRSDCICSPRQYIFTLKLQCTRKRGRAGGTCPGGGGMQRR